MNLCRTSSWILNYPEDKREYRQVLRKVRERYALFVRQMLPQRRSEDDACLSDSDTINCQYRCLIPISQHCAQTLLDFNGGTSCVQVYVNQHDFFMNKTREHVDHSDNLYVYSILSFCFAQSKLCYRWGTISNPDESTPRTELGLTELFGEIRATVAQESQIVQAVFPNPPLVMQVFLQRVFAQSVRLAYSTTGAERSDTILQIQQYIEQLLNKGGSISELAYLRILQLIHVETSALVDDLKKHELPSLTPSRSSSLGAVYFRNSLTNTHSAAHGATTVSAMLETAMEELFMPYTEGQKYIDRESRSLTDLYASLLSNFTQFHVSLALSSHPAANSYIA